jgi:cullin 3
MMASTATNNTWTSVKSNKIHVPRPNIPSKEELAIKNWTTLSNAIDAVYEQGVHDWSYEQLHRCIYELIFHNYGPSLYTNVENAVLFRLEQIKDLLRNHQQKQQEQRDGDYTSNELFLRFAVQLWKQYKLSTHLLSQMFMYMDNVYVERNSNLRKVFDNGMYLFRTCILEEFHLGEKLRNIFLQCMHRERNYEKIDRSLMNEVCVIFCDLNCYEQMLEVDILNMTREFYYSLGQQLIQTTSIAQYLKIVVSRMQEESMRANSYLPLKTKPKLEAILKEELITKHMEQIIGSETSGFLSMLENDQLEGLEIMYKVFCSEESHLVEMVNQFREYISRAGTNYVLDTENTKDPLQFIQGLINQKRKYIYIIAQSFRNNDLFLEALDAGFTTFANGIVQSGCANYLSSYLHDIISKSGQKELFDIEFLLEQVIDLFKYLRDKDLFEMYYKVHLSKRLLARSDSYAQGIEKLFITKLRRECGYGFTSKVEGMLNDMESSSHLNDRYREHPTYSLRGNDIDFYVNVLTTSFWPSYANNEIMMPSQMKTCCDSFTKFYADTYSGRKLKWKTNLGTAVLVAVYPPNTYELLVSTQQAILLLAFNDKEKSTYSELRSQMDFPDADLKRCLLQLSLGKQKILRKQIKSTEIGMDEEFRVNLAFKSPNFRIKLNVINTKETEAEAKQTESKVDQERRPLIEAAIVRVMKARKRLHHNQLVEETIKQLSSRFTPDLTEIKKRIENLIDREFLTRTEEDHHLYDYLA